MFLFLENICPLNKGFHIKNTIFNLSECRQRYFLSLSKRCVGYLHHKEAVNCEILMSICLALMDLERAVVLDTWKMKKIKTIVEEKGGYFNAIFVKLHQPIQWYTSILDYLIPLLLSRTILPSIICLSCTHF